MFLSAEAPTAAILSRDVCRHRKTHSQPLFVFVRPFRLHTASYLMFPCVFFTTYICTVCPLPPFITHELGSRLSVSFALPLSGDFFFCYRSHICRAHDNNVLIIIACGVACVIQTLQPQIKIHDDFRKRLNEQSDRYVGRKKKFPNGKTK